MTGLTDPTELIARLENGFFYTQFGEASDVPDQPAVPQTNDDRTVPV